MATVTASAEGVLGQLAEQAGALVAAVRGGLLAGQPVQRLGGVLAGARRVQAQLDWVLLAVAGEVDRSGGYAVDGALSPQGWLRRRARLAPGEASLTVRAARAFASGQLAATGAALAAGDIDGGHARLIAAAVAEAPAGAVALIEPLALDAAGDYSAPEVARLLAWFRYALDPDGADAAARRRYEQRGLSAAATVDGLVAGRFLLDPVAGASLLTALDAAAPAGTGDTRTAAQRRADALETLAGHFLATSTARRNAGAHPHLLLTAPTSGPPAGQPTPSGGSRFTSPGPARLTWVGPVPPGTADRVAGDAHVVVAGVDPDGHVTSVARRRRFFTWTQRMAIIARDGDTCPWPWCDRPIWWSDAHHLHPWQDGGPTTVANGVLPCAGHHQLLHEGRWRLEWQPDGGYLARHRSGRTIGPQPHRRE